MHTQQTPPHHGTRPSIARAAPVADLQYRTDLDDRRCFGSSTDDVAIFIDDTLDRATVRCLSSSPSAVAILSPQRLPISHQRHTDATELDLVCGYAAGMSLSAKKRGNKVRSFASDVTNFNAGVVQALTFKSDGQSTPSSQYNRPPSMGTTPKPAAPREMSDALCGTSPYCPVGFVPLVEFERMEKERHRYQKMYEHQKGLYEDMVESQQQVQERLQDKIVEVVALSTRNEESKRFIRQLKREMLESRTRVLDLHNRQWDESRNDRTSKDRLQSILAEQEAQFTTKLQQQEARMAGLEGLVRDLTALRGEAKALQVAQLDHLLKASYTKNAALFGDLVRQGRQLELLTDRKVDLEKAIEMMRRERRDAEANIAAERRNMNQQNERYTDQLTEQQRAILELRQCLVRTMASESSSTSEEDDEEVPIAPDDEDEMDHVHHTTSRMQWDGIPIPPPLPTPPTSYLVGSSSSSEVGVYEVGCPVRPIRRRRAVPPGAPSVEEDTE